MQAWVAPALGAASGIGSGLISAAAQGKRDHDSRNFALMQGDIEWERQQQGWNMQNFRDDALWNRQNAYNEMAWNKQNAYNESLWDRQNKYNSPMAQMERFKEAGLNPNLIYGQSNPGAPISAGQLDTAKQPSGRAPSGGRPSNWAPGPFPHFDVMNGLLNGLAFREKSAQIDNLREQNEVLRQETLLKAATTASVAAGTALTGVNTKRASFDLDLAGDLRSTSIDAAKANLRKTSIESDLALHNDQRAKVMQGATLRQMADQLKSNQSTRDSQELDRQLKEMDIKLRRLGIQPNDNMMFRILGRVFGKLEEKFPDYSIDLTKP